MLHPKRRLPRVDVARAGLVRVLLNLYLVYRNVARRFYLACRCCEILQSDIRRRSSVGLAVQNKNAAQSGTFHAAPSSFATAARQIVSERW